MFMGFEKWTTVCVFFSGFECERQRDEWRIVREVAWEPTDWNPNGEAINLSDSLTLHRL